MAVIEGGVSGALLGIGAQSQSSAHVEAKPISYGSLGHYRISQVTGTLAAALAAGAPLFAARWTDATRFAVVTKLKARFLPLTPFTAATLTDHTSIDAYVARAFSASYTGGTALVASKMRAAMGGSLMGDLRIATTAALAGGTLTFDSSPFAQSLRKGNRVNPAAGTEETTPDAFDSPSLDFDMGGGDHPVVLAANEGVVIRNRTVWPLAGTGILMVMLTWAEVTAF